MACRICHPRWPPCRSTPLAGKNLLHFRVVVEEGKNTEIPSTIEILSLGSIRRQSSWNQRLTASS